MAVFRFNYKGIPIDASFCTLGTLQVSSRFVNFPKGSATYLNSTADKINVNFGYKDASIDLSNKFNAYTQEYNASITNTFTASGNLSSSYTNVTTTIPTYIISNIYSKIGVLSYGGGGGGGGGGQVVLTTWEGGGGGGAGGMIFQTIPLTQPNGRLTTFNGTMNQGGGGGFVQYSGEAGGNTTFTISGNGGLSYTLTANGGSPGNSTSNGGNGGAGGNTSNTYTANSNNILITSTGAAGSSRINGIPSVDGGGNNQVGGPGGDGYNSTNPTFILSSSKQTTTGGYYATSNANIGGQNNYSGCPGTDNNYNPTNAVSLFFNGGTKVYNFTGTGGNTTIGYAGGGGGGGGNNTSNVRQTYGGPGAPGFIKIWLYI